MIAIRWQALSIGALIPLYYSRKTDHDRLLATLIGGYRAGTDGKRWLIYPLLSWGHRDEQGGEFWAAASCIHAQWDKSGKTSHAIPYGSFPWRQFAFIRGYEFFFAVSRV